MHLSAEWIVPLCVGSAGAAALAAVAVLARREVTRLQKAMLPLRTSGRRRPGRRP
ncbi:MAG TPA: hypothetical protein VFN68_12940 [Acidimicrobiales bacterium]|nr:hypothetical protein [Acidimicrobiales bacterium]